jgi:DNA-binding GntR family transcriptional regulator
MLLRRAAYSDLRSKALKDYSDSLLAWGLARASKTRAKEPVAMPKKSIQPATKPRTATDQAYEDILDLLLHHELRPGERTSVNLLADRLQLGRTPIKEAITRLEAEGLLSVAGRSGTMANVIDSTQAKQLFALRQVLEDFAAEEAVKHVTSEQIKRLKELTQEMRRQSLNSDYSRSTIGFVSANVEFHALIVAAAGNPFLLRLYSQIQMQTQIVTYLIHRGYDPGHLLEQFSRQMWRTSHARRAVRDLVGFALCEGDEVLDRMNAQRRMHHKNVRDGSDERNRRQVLLEVYPLIGREGGIDRHRDRSEQERIPIGRLPRDILSRDHASGSRAIFHDNGSPENLAKLRCNDPSSDIGRGARTEPYDEADGPTWISAVRAGCG